MNLQHHILQSSVSHSEIILICWFAVQETFLHIYILLWSKDQLSSEIKKLLQHYIHHIIQKLGVSIIVYFIYLFIYFWGGGGGGIKEMNTII